MFPDIPTLTPRPKRIKEMYAVYGKTEGKTCKTCVHLLRIKYNKTFLKCELAYMSHSTASDWRAGWDACGKYESKGVVV